MIKINDIRTGNLVLFKRNNQTKVWITNPFDFRYMQQNNELFHPITLSAETVAACKLQGFTLVKSEGCSHYEVLELNNHILEVKYLHQLQNLYYSIQGKELIIDYGRVMTETLNNQNKIAS